MDPIGFALENFDLVGRWRSLDNGLPIDSTAEMVDGTYIDGPASLREALLARPEAFMFSITERLLTYALGRELEYFDAPAVRGIVQEAAAEGFNFSALVQAVVASEPFQWRIKVAETALTSAQVEASPEPR